jgi:hypothetical protein
MWALGTDGHSAMHPLDMQTAIETCEATMNKEASSLRVHSMDGDLATSYTQTSK